MGLYQRQGTRISTALGLRIFYAVSRRPGTSARQLADELGESIKTVTARLSDMRNTGLLRSDVDVGMQTNKWYVNVKTKRA